MFSIFVQILSSEGVPYLEGHVVSTYIFTLTEDIGPCGGQPRSNKVSFFSVGALIA